MVWIRLIQSPKELALLGLRNNMKYFVSIIIPAYNEEKDIGKTLETCLRLGYPKKEIIVVNDGSTDKTADIIGEYKGVVLVNQENKGRCAARNRGILKAKGEIVVLLDADVLLKPDFIDRILPHYQKGIDYLLVETEFIDKKYLFPRFEEAQHHFNYDKREDLEWSQAFSCRKEAAIKVGMFATEAPLPLVGGEDSYLGKRLRDKGYRKKIDRSIIVCHNSPESFKGFWKSRKEASYYFMSFFVDKVPLFRLFIGACLRTLIIIGQILLLIPSFVQAYKISCFSERGRKDLFPFFFAFILQQLAFISGKWGSLIKISRCKL